jgi:hypothetical protein
MNQRTSFYRKIAYIVGIAVLLLLLYFFGRPPTRGGANVRPSPGGILAQQRTKHKLNQTELGEINATGETIKLATLGLRGVAALMLWEKSNDFKMKEDWAKYEATLNQITVIEPHFLAVWIHLAWNLSYNVSVEFDNYRDRYRWVIAGINYLQKGIEYNGNDPQLFWHTGWTVSQKIGRADEHKLFRKLFRADDEFHGSRPKAERDNWLVGKTWYDECIVVARATGKRMKGKPPIIYYSSPAMCLMNYAEALEEEGTFGDVAQLAWKKAYDAWLAYGNRLIPEPGTEELYLENLEKYENILAQKVKELDELEPGLREKVRQKKLEALPEEQRAALDVPLEKRTPKELEMASLAEMELDIRPEALAEKVSVEHRAKAKELAAEALRNESIALEIRRSRDTVNYNYWKLRALVEQDPEAVAARKDIYEATQMFRRDANLPGAKDKFHEGFMKWRALLDKYPALIDDSLTGDDILEFVKVYETLLKKMSESFPQPFILQDVLDKHAIPK